MKTDSVLKIVKRLESTMNYKYSDSSELTKALMRLDYDIANKAVDSIQKNGVLERGEKVFKLPSIPQFLDIYNSLTVKEQKRKECIVCGGIGAMSRGEKIEESWYEFALHCDECSSEYRSKYGYYTEPISKYYDIENIKAQNAFKDKTPKPIPDYIKDLCRKLKLNINAILNPKGREGGAV